jgi:large subunit ribosomal protein L21
MFAIIETSGKQYRVEPGARVVVDRVDAAVGDTITLGNVLLLAGDGVKIGKPTVEGASVEARVVEHFRGEKVITFKYRRRKRTRRTVGSRHSHTALEIVGIKA